jgi:hypothetical protein
MEGLTKGEQIQELSTWMAQNGVRFNAQQRFAMFKLFVCWDHNDEWTVGDADIPDFEFDPVYAGMARTMRIENLCIRDMMTSIIHEIQSIGIEHISLIVSCHRFQFLPKNL